MRDLRIGGIIALHGRADGAHLAAIIDLHHIGRDGGLERAPDQSAGGREAEPQAAKRHETPVLRLDSGATYSVIPDLSGFLVGRLRGGALAVAGCTAFEEHH